MIAGCVDAIGPQAGNIARLSWLAAGYPGGGARRHRRPAVRFQPAGHFLWRTGDHVRHRRSDRGRRHAEHEPDPHLVGDDRRRAVRVHLADQRVQELAAPLRRSGDLAVPRFGADRREVGHLARGDGAVRAGQPSACAGRRSAPATSRTRSSRSTASSPTRARATRRWRRWPACKTLVEGGRLTAAMASQISDGASAVLLASEQAVKDHGLKPRARIHHISARGADPVFMLTGPIPATRYALEKTGPVDRRHRHRRDQRGVRAGRAWRGSRRSRPTRRRSTPTAARSRSVTRSARPGAKLFATMLNTLERTGGRYGLQTMCEGGGTANVTIIERL